MEVMTVVKFVYRWFYVKGSLRKPAEMYFSYVGMLNVSPRSVTGRTSRSGVVLVRKILLFSC